jgi:hypothetical protein
MNVQVVFVGRKRARYPKKRTVLVIGGVQRVSEDSRGKGRVRVVFGVTPDANVGSLRGIRNREGTLGITG